MKTQSRKEEISKSKVLLRPFLYIQTSQILCLQFWLSFLDNFIFLLFQIYLFLTNDDLTSIAIDMFYCWPDAFQKEIPYCNGPFAVFLKFVQLMKEHRPLFRDPSKVLLSSSHNAVSLIGTYSCQRKSLLQHILWSRVVACSNWLEAYKAPRKASN